MTISKRLGHASPNVTLAVYAHLFQRPRKGRPVDSSQYPTSGFPQEQAWLAAYYRRRQLLIERDTTWVSTSVKVITDFVPADLRALLLANGRATPSLCWL